MFLQTMQRGDVGVVQLGQKTCLSLEAVEVLWVSRELFGKDLDGDITPECSVLGAVDFAHPAFANQLEDFVVAERGSLFQRHANDDFVILCGAADELKEARDARSCAPLTVTWGDPRLIYNVTERVGHDDAVVVLAVVQML